MSELKNPIKVLVRRTGQEPTVEVIENDLRSKQKIVGGYIEMPYNPDFSEGLQIVCNEEGKFADDPKPNVHWGDYDIIFGDILFVGIDDEGDDISLMPEQIDEAKKWIAENEASGYDGMGDGSASAAASVVFVGSLDDVIKDFYADIKSEPTKATHKNKDKGFEM